MIQHTKSTKGFLSVMIIVAIGKCTVKMMMTTITISVIPRVQTITIIIYTSLLAHYTSLSIYIVEAVEDTLYIVKTYTQLHKRYKLVSLPRSE